MSKSNTFENELLLLVYNNTDIADIGDAGGLQNSAAAGSLYVALHTGDPGEGGTQATSECAYAGPYARQAVARSALGWTVSGNQVSNTALIQFPQCSGGSETAQYVSVGRGRVRRHEDPLVGPALVQPRHLVRHPAAVRHRRAGHHGGLSWASPAWEHSPPPHPTTASAGSRATAS